MKRYTISAISGGGIKAEIISAGIEAIDARAAACRTFPLAFGLLTFEQFDRISDDYRHHGTMMPADGLARITGSDTIFLDAVGVPDVPDHLTPRGLYSAIRQSFDSCANVRLTYQPTGNESPLHNVSPGPQDRVVVQEGTEGEYAEQGSLPGEVATETPILADAGVTRIMRFAFEWARSLAHRKMTISPSPVFGGRAW